jgi:hypothetical protein
MLAFGMMAVVIAVALVSLFSYVASEKKFRETLTLVMSDPELRWNEKEHRFQYKDLDFFYRKFSGSRNRPPYFSVSVVCQGTGGGFGISKEGGVERFFKGVGVTREVQTPEEEFNRRFFIASDTPQFAQDYFVSAEKREAMRQLFDGKASTVTYGDQRVTVTWKGSSAHTDGIAAIKSTAGALAVLAKDIPACPDPASSAGTESGVSSNRVWMTGLAAGSLVAGLVSVVWTSAGYPVYDAWQLFLFSLKFSLPALAVFLYFAVLTLAGTSRSHKDILRTGFLALAGFLMLGCGLTGLYNGMKDTSPPAGHTVSILDKRIYKSKNSRTYKLIVQSWRPGNAIEDLPTNRGTFQRVVPGKHKVVVYTRPGKLGFEWFVTYRLL